MFASDWGAGRPGLALRSGAYYPLTAQSPTCWLSGELLASPFRLISVLMGWGVAVSRGSCTEAGRFGARGRRPFCRPLELEVLSTGGSSETSSLLASSSPF